MAEKSIGLIELSSIAAGFQVADTMLKAGNVRLLLSRSICSGKYMVLIGGDTAAVDAAVAAGCEAANGCLIDSFVIRQPPSGRLRGARPHATGGAERRAGHHRILQRRHAHPGGRRRGQNRHRATAGSPPRDGAGRQGVLHDDRRRFLRAGRRRCGPGRARRGRRAGERRRHFPAASRRVSRSGLIPPGDCRADAGGQLFQPLTGARAVRTQKKPSRISRAGLF